MLPARRLSVIRRARAMARPRSWSSPRVARRANGSWGCPRGPTTTCPSLLPCRAGRAACGRSSAEPSGPWAIRSPPTSSRLRRLVGTRRRHEAAGSTGARSRFRAGVRLLATGWARTAGRDPGNSAGWNPRLGRGQTSSIARDRRLHQAAAREAATTGPIPRYVATVAGSATGRRVGGAGRVSGASRDAEDAG